MKGKPKLAIVENTPFMRCLFYKQLDGLPGFARIPK